MSGSMLRVGGWLGIVAAVTACSGGAGTAGARLEGPVWSTQSTGFEMISTGGLVSNAQICSVETSHYDAASRVITLTECGKIAVAAQLSIDSASALLARLTALMAKGPLTGCGADAPDMVLTVFDRDGAQRRYVSDFYSGCGVTVRGVTTGPGPYVPSMDLDYLSNMFYRFTVACQAGGSANDAGATCVALPSDAGDVPPG